ncbi:MAG: cytidine deaminase [Cryomorphaceae bacterium]|nr:MAG: cytidine deaminase [Cryomorphaceae bacterium]
MEIRNLAHLMKAQTIEIKVEVFPDRDALPGVQKQLLDMADEASGRAYAPYSRFHVGAAVLLENGETITGSNQENGAYPSGLCAERVALFAAKARFPSVPIVALAIFADGKDMPVSHPVSPCGGCRQVMSEYELNQPGPYPVVFQGGKGEVYRTGSAAALLPLQFRGNFLKKD